LSTRAAIKQKAPFGRLKSTALLLAGCREFEYSYDAWFNNRANGAFTRAALDALAQMPPSNLSFHDWFKRGISQHLPTQQYPQVPQIQGTSSQQAWTF
jgi:hypothetical protein